MVTNFETLKPNQKEKSNKTIKSRGGKIPCTTAGAGVDLAIYQEIIQQERSIKTIKSRGGKIPCTTAGAGVELAIYQEIMQQERSIKTIKSRGGKIRTCDLLLPKQAR